MRNIKLTIEYDGENYCGWQVQNKLRKPSIQGTIQKVLEKVLQEKIDLVGSGRTDSGVHALAQTANFQTNSKIAVAQLKIALNGLLPSDITIKKVQDVPLGFNSRVSAESKIYRYLILNSEHHSAILDKFVYFYHYKLDLELMKKELKFLIGEHDFKPFCASGSSIKGTVRRIKQAKLKKVNFLDKDYEIIVIELESNGFLYNMVRSIVGTLLEVGRGRFESGRIKRILEEKRRNLVGTTVPARGLHLVKVKY